MGAQLFHADGQIAMMTLIVTFRNFAKAPISKNEKNSHTDKYCNSIGQECHVKGKERELKYVSLLIEIQRMWNIKGTIKPVIIGAMGIVTKG